MIRVHPAFLFGLIVVALLAGMLAGTTTDRALVEPFVDTANHPYAWAIEEIRLAGLTAGCQTDPPMFCPDRPLTRGEAAVLLARLLDDGGSK